ncbi:hypothetical protein LDENG_00294550 [Lucifuga dentata]|nr:hypothetical protein LDENG_00294550 [Lucifuga dentata]
MDDFLNDTEYLSGDYDDEVCDKGRVVKFGSIVIPVFFSVVIALSLTGNILVLVILALYENIKSLINIFILNLAISDLVFTLGLPFWAIYHIWGWVLSERLCKTVTFIFFTGFYSSILFLTIMTIYRYLTVVQPLSDVNKHGARSGIIVSIILWGVSVGAALPYFLYSSVHLIHHNEQQSLACESGDYLWKTVGVYQQNIFFLVAFVVMAFCYMQILVKITRTRSHTKNRAVKLIFCIVAVFFVGWVPYNVIIFLTMLADHLVAPFDNCEVSTHLDYAFAVSRLIAFSHCCLNPVFYAFVGVKFRSHLKSLLHRMFSCQSPVEEQQSLEIVIGLNPDNKMWSLHKLCGVLIGLHIFTKAKGYPNGNFPEACQSMLPQHERLTRRFHPPENSPPPFEVTYTLGKKEEPITVHLTSKSSQTAFKGFMLEARETEDGPPVGKFILLDPARLLKCNGSSDSAVSQKNNRGKSVINVNWTGHGVEQGIIFRATFLQYYGTFWERVNATLSPHTTTTEPSTTISTTKPSTASATEASTTSATEASTTTHATEASITSVTTEASTTHTTKRSTTSSAESSPASTKEPSTAPGTISSSTASPTTPTSVTSNSSNPTDTEVQLRAAVSQMAGSSALVAVSQPGTLPSLSPSAHPYHSPWVKICRVLSMVAQIIALILLCLWDSSKVTIIALVCVTIFLNIKEMIITFLPIGPSHELKEICHYTFNVFSIIHEIFTIAVIFVGVLEIEGWATSKEESWLLKVTAGYTAWIFLFFIWIFIISNYRESKWRSRIGYSKTVRRYNQENKKVKLGAAEVISICISVIFYVGIISFTVTIIVGSFM